MLESRCRRPPRAARMTDGSLHSERGRRFAWQQSFMNSGDPAQRPDRPLRDGVDGPCRSSLSVIAAREIRQPKVVGSPNQRTRWQREAIETGHHAMGGRCSLVDKRGREGGELRLVPAAAEVNAIDIAAADPLPLPRKATIRVFRIRHRWMTAVQHRDKLNPDEAFMTATDTSRDAEPDESFTRRPSALLPMRPASRG